jgi:hypothetical protein
MDSETARIETLRRHLCDEFCKALGLNAGGWYHGLIDLVVRTPTQRFAEIGASFDDWVRRLGFAEATRRVLRQFVSDYSAHGLENVPPAGPLLVTSNHPGTYDCLLIAASVGRDDMMIVTGDIRFLQALPSASEHLLYFTTNLHQRVGALRRAIRHLEAGGSLLIFPSGHIDPDPDVLPGGHDALHDWSPSLEVMLRRVPDTRAMVTIVSGVLAARCTRNLLTRVRKQARDRQRVAEFLQVMQQMVLKRSVALFPRVSFAEPLTLTDLRQASGVAGAMDGLVALAQRALALHMAYGST